MDAAKPTSLMVIGRRCGMTEEEISKCFEVRIDLLVIPYRYFQRLIVPYYLYFHVKINLIKNFNWLRHNKPISLTGLVSSWVCYFQSEKMIFIRHVLVLCLCLFLR